VLAFEAIAEQQAKLSSSRGGVNGGKLTFIHDPWGTSIELNERPNPL
jgi:hypothetical protein